MAEYYGMTIATPGKFDDWEIEDILELSLEEQPKSSITDLFKYHTWDRDRKALVSDNGQMIYKFRQNARFAFYKIVMTPKRKRKNSIKPAGAKRKPSPGTAAYRKKVAAWLDGKIGKKPMHVKLPPRKKKAKPMMTRNPAKKTRDLSRGYFIVKSRPAGYFDMQWSMAHFTLAQVKEAALAKCKKYNCQAAITEFWS